MNFPRNRKYHSEHLWVQEQSDGTCRIGITEHAQEQLGSIIFVDLPNVGAIFKQGESCASIESVKVTSEAIIPQSGVVQEINARLASTPELLNTNPYDEGWLIVIKPTDINEKGTISAEEYENRVGH